jgi:ribosomal-protein-serine acetyltransferase
MVVSIRPYCIEDAAAVCEASLESGPEVYPFMPWCRPGLTMEDQRAWIQAQVVAFEGRAAYEFAIVSEDGHYLGGCGLNQIDAVNHRANLGYWVRSSAAGRGVATAAVAQLVEWGFSHTDLVRLEVVVSTQNAASLRVAEKTGAVREGIARSRLLLHGTWHDAIVFAFVRDDHKSSRPSLPSQSPTPIGAAIPGSAEWRSHAARDTDTR